MQVALPSRGLAIYTSKPQRARVATEAWASENLYCPSCSSPELVSADAGTPVIDFPRAGYVPHTRPAVTRRTPSGDFHHHAAIVVLLGTALTPRYEGQLCQKHCGAKRPAFVL